MVINEDGQRRPSSQFEVDLEGHELESHAAMQTGRVPRTDLTDKFNSRHLGMIAMGSAIGTGLMIGTGSSLARGGPVGLLIGYVIVGMAVQTVMAAHSEMSAWLPMPDSITGYASRFVDPAVGFATGWNYVLTHLTLLPINLAVTATLIQYWDPGLSPTTWVIMVATLIFITNIFGAAVFAEIEFVLSVLKMAIVVLFLVLCIVVASNEGPLKNRMRDFRPWYHPGPFSTLMAPGSKGHALGVWNAIVQAVFAYLGTEMVAVAFGETPDPLRSVPKTVKKTAGRIFILYLLAIFIIGVTLPHTLAVLQHATVTSRAASPFILAATGNARLVSAVNGMLAVFTISAANANVYLASRALWSLSRNGQAPAFLQRTNSQGMPVRAALVSVAFAALGFVSINEKTMEACRYLVALATTFGAINWLSILGSHVSMSKAMDQQGVHRMVMPYISNLLPWGAHVAGPILALVILFSGIVAAYPKRDLGVILVGYVGPVLFLVNIVLWRWLRGTRRRDPMYVDLETNRST